ncbi:phenylalanine--tRNA ligase subunit beta [Candidatus Campbellbacteria bacterium]|nr:MAG: phenylalanine--tRNA ligase subunit beta [Candidatus Campbellbacteria bacterium]
MKFSYNTIQKYFEDKLPEAEKLAEAVGLHSFELEGIEEVETESGYKDVLIDWDILPNRSSDCLCYMGIVKEISAVLDIPYTNFQDQYKEHKFSSDFKTSDFVNLEVQDTNLVPKATKIIARNVKIKESPEWLKNFLESIDQKSINNVVDITNYVMWITGQPVHAFDYNKLAGEGKKNIYIKFAEDGQKVTDLSGDEHELDGSVLVIADDQKALDIAGIKGGEVSGVDQNTDTLMLSAVNFNFKNIRTSSKKLKLQTDASKRFENEVPQEKTVIAMDFMSYLLEKYAEAEVSAEIVDTKPDLETKAEIEFKFEKINSLLGLELSDGQIVQILKRLEIEVLEKEDKVFAKVPFERLDLNIWQDLAEEVGRIYGLENIKESLPVEEFKIPRANKLKEMIYHVSDVLVDYGFFEVYNRTLNEQGKVELLNPLSANAKMLRSSLLPLLFQKGDKNLQHSDDVKFFEIGKVFLDDKTENENKVVEERFYFAGYIPKRKIKDKFKEDLFLETKGYLEKVFEKIGIENVEWKESSEGDFVAEVSKNDEVFGNVGVNFWELDLEKMLELVDFKVEYKTVSKYPTIKRDVSFFVPVDFQVKVTEDLIKSVLPTETVDLELFDIYKDKENNRKSFAFNIVFQSMEKTLDDVFANEAMDKVYDKLKESGFEIR